MKDKPQTRLSVDRLEDRTMPALIAGQLPIATLPPLTLTTTQVNTLLQRAAALLPEGDERRLALAPDLCDALWEAGDTTAIASVLAAARRTTDAVLGAMVAIVETEPQLGAADGSTPGERLEKQNLARSVLEAAGHDEGLSLYWWYVGHDAWFRCRAEETAAACELALFHAQRAGSRRRARDAALWISGSCVFGPMPVPAAIERVEDIRTRSGGSALSEASCRYTPDAGCDAWGCG
jgi:hypothetical protein